MNFYAYAFVGNANIPGSFLTSASRTKSDAINRSTGMLLLVRSYPWPARRY